MYATFSPFLDFPSISDGFIIFPFTNISFPSCRAFLIGPLGIFSSSAFSVLNLPGLSFSINKYPTHSIECFSLVYSIFLFYLHILFFGFIYDYFFINYFIVFIYFKHIYISLCIVFYSNRSSDY